MRLAEEKGQSAASRQHVAVMVDEVVGLVRALNPLTMVDVTVGMGGHAAALLRATDGHLIGIDRDATALAAAAANLAEFGSRVTLRRADFSGFEAVLEQSGIPCVGAIVADLGMSSFALNDAERGFSFRLDGPLDMRMDRSQQLRAYDIVNEETEAELARIIHRIWRGARCAADRARDRRGAPAASARNHRRTRRFGRERDRPQPARRDPSGDANFSGAQNRGQQRTRKSRDAARLRAGAPACGRPHDRARVSFARGSAGQAALPRTGARGIICGRDAQGDASERGRVRGQSARAQRPFALYRAGGEMTRRARPAAPPSKIMPALLAIAIVAAGFAMLMVRLEVTQEGYRLSSVETRNAQSRDRKSAAQARNGANWNRISGCASWRPSTAWLHRRPDTW